MSKLRDQKRKAEKALAEQLAKVEAFPQCESAEEALAALCHRAANGSTPEDLEAKIVVALKWFLSEGLLEAVKLQREAKYLSASKILVDGYAAQGHLKLIQDQLDEYFEAQAEKSQNGARPSEEIETDGLLDATLYGAIAPHYPSGDPEIASVRSRLISRLTSSTTPSSVQRAAGRALSSLFRADDLSTAEDALHLFFEELRGPEEVSRRGAALGVAAVVKGSGHASFKKLGVMATILESARAEGKASATKRQGAFFCLEAVANALQKQFEPHAVATIPLFLNSCSDPAKEVASAARDAAKSVVGQMSAIGAKMLVAPILKALRDTSWRTRLGGLEILNLSVVVMAAANDGPQRLGALLPKLIPPLCEAAAESRAELRDAAREVLQEICGAIPHEDLKPMAPTLVAALTDPADATTSNAVDSLLDGVFTSYLDATSLVLIAPVIDRGLCHKNPTTRMRAAGLLKGMSQLVADAVELSPYFVDLWPQLRAILVDPGPEVRVAAAQALGAVLTVLQEGDVDWAPYLYGLLAESRDSAELDGAALSLSSAFAMVSKEKQLEIMNEILKPEPPQALAGRLGVCAYLPKTLGSDFACLIPRVLPVLFAGLSHELEAVRETCDRGLNTVCEASPQIVPPEALIDEFEKVPGNLNLKGRIAAIKLSGALIKRLGPGAAQQRLLISAILSKSDENGTVRNNAERVFRQAMTGSVVKGLRTLKPHLLANLSRCFSSGNDVLAEMAGRCAVDLQNLMREETLIDEVAPLLVEALKDEKPAERKSALVATLEIFKLKQGQEIPSLVAAVTAAVGDGDPSVRTAATACAKECGLRSGGLADPLLDSICNAQGELPEESVAGLQDLLRTQGKDVLPSLLKRTVPPFHLGTVALLAAAAAASPEALQDSVAEITEALLSSVLPFDENDDPAVHDVAIKAATEIARNLDEDAIAEVGEKLVPVLAGPCDRAEPTARLLRAFLAGAASPPSEPGPLLQALLPHCLAGSKDCTTGLLMLQKSYGTGPLTDEVPSIHMALVTMDGDKTEATALPEAVEALLPILQQGLVGSGGSAPYREEAAEALALLVRYADTAATKAFAVKLAGPILRMLTSSTAEDKDLACALVEALNVLLTREAQALKALAPAIQTALIKFLDESWGEKLQNKASEGLEYLAPIAPRPEALVKSICKGKPTNAYLSALERVLKVLKQPTSSEIQKVVIAYREAAGVKASDVDIAIDMNGK